MVVTLIIQIIGSIDEHKSDDSLCPLTLVKKE